jgi:hypothetical protein
MEVELKSFGAAVDRKAEDISVRVWGKE